MIPCPICNLNSIDSVRNKRRKCKSCADSEIRSKRMKEIKHLTFQDGCHKALRDSTNASVHGSSLLQCHPVKLKIKKYNDMKNIAVYALLHNEEVKNLSTQLNLDYGETSRTFKAELHVAEQPADIDVCKKCSSSQSATNSEEISSLVTTSSMPQLLATLGPYQEIDEEVIRMLNQDFRLDPKKISLVPQLFAGSIIHDQLALIALTVEVYARYATLDIHLETNADSVPCSGCHYKGLFCEIITTSDGHNQLRKLVIGSHTINLLITCSSTLSYAKLQEVFTGPQVNVSPTSFTRQRTKIFLRSEEVQTFKQAFMSNENINKQPSISQLRQLSSSFDHVSSYLYWRATLDDMNDIRFMPSTVFSLCDTADHDGYGSNHNSLPKVSSLLLQIIAIHLNSGSYLTKEAMAPFLTAYASANHNDDVEGWNLLKNIATEINLLVDRQMPMSRFITKVNLSKVAGHVGNHLNKANQKISNNVKERLLKLYG